MRDAKVVERGLEEIALLLGFSDKGRFKAQAYERGAEIVNGLAFELGPTIERGRLTEIDGIGPSLSKQIVELWETGSSSLLDRLRAENPPGAGELARVPGMTHRRIRAVHEGLGVSSIESLREACEAGRVRTLPGFGAKTEQRILEGLAAMQQAERAEPRMLLSDALALAEQWLSGLRALPGVIEAELAGAARRGEETLREVALVVVLEEPTDHAALRTWLSERGDVLTIEVDGALVRVARVDAIAVTLQLSSAADAGHTLLEATGPSDHVDALRARAEQRGRALSAHAENARASEGRLYRDLELAPVPPELRARERVLHDAERDDFADLIEAADIRGYVHCHTTHSDGRNSVEEMARAAKDRGMQYITITDHSPSAYYARGVTLERLQAQWDELRDVEQRVGIRVLRGTESDILADGNLDYPEDVLAQFDVVIASIHSRFKMSRADMTARLVRAMKLPIFKIWGHALGRLLLSRAPIECDVEQVLDALAESHGAIEINGDPHRLDLPPEWIRPARERGIPFVLSVDAHSTRGLGVLPFAAQMGRRGGLRRAEVLNTLDAESFVSRVKPA
jgi:DNA polymerase (family 10)